MAQSFPVHIGNGVCRVSVYSPTSALPYFRLSYRLGAKRVKRTRRTFREAEELATAVHRHLKNGTLTIAQITQADLAVHTNCTMILLLEVYLAAFEFLTHC